MNWTNPAAMLSAIRTIERRRGDMEIDRRSFIAGLGGVAAVSAMSSEAKADALEHYMEDRLDAAVALQQGGAAPAIALWASTTPGRKRNPSPTHANAGSRWTMRYLLGRP